jgi:pre-mRNA-processing factor SLU7
MTNDPSLEGASLPDFVKKQPWYFNTGDDSIDHQRIAPFAAQKHTSLTEFYHHGRSRDQEVVKWRPGCCTNCGSRTHSSADCTERPRKRNARAAGQSIAPKESVEQHELSYEAKRDSFANYGSDRWWQEVGGRFRFADQVRSKSAADSGSSLAIQAEYGHSGFRDRNDVAFYIESIRTGKPAVAPDDDQWVKTEARPPPVSRQVADTSNPAVEQQHAREFYEGRQMLAKDGAIATETGIEAMPMSRYGAREDILENGHTSVFGSYWESGHWGYACCHQLDRDAHCTHPS